ncbi:Transmembrane protease serine 11A, partial [Armadillidium nasatum]
CIYQELGATSNFEITPHVDFYIPHNWANNDDNLNYLLMKLFSRQLVLRHPSSSIKNPNEIKLPLESMKIGWNRLFLKRDGDTLQIIRLRSFKLLQSFRLSISLIKLIKRNPLFVSGLHSLVECHKDLNTRYYKIPAGKSVKIPYVMFKQVDRFDAYSETSPFSFEITLSGKRRKICMEEIRDQPNVYSVPRECRHWPINNFSQDTVYNIYMYPAAYDKQDILKYNDFTFTDFELHNIGNSDFYIRTFIKPESNAPISLLEGGCGINSKKDIFNRIAGGVTAKSKDWPWMVAFVKNSDGVIESHVCGGVLITQRLVLTSASCFYVKIHESYNPEVNNEYDIALIKLNSSAGESFPPVCLTPSGANWDDQFGYVTGWGKISFGGPDSNQLREALVQVWKKSECDVAYPNEITDNMICAGGREDKGSCEGDTGGPLVAQILPETRWYVVGIDSWGLGCGFDNSPTVYTKVDSYLEWIKLNYNM